MGSLAGRDADGVPERRANVYAATHPPLPFGRLSSAGTVLRHRRLAARAGWVAPVRRERLAPTRFPEVQDIGKQGVRRSESKAIDVDPFQVGEADDAHAVLREANVLRLEPDEVAAVAHDPRAVVLADRQPPRVVNGGTVVEPASPEQPGRDLVAERTFLGEHPVPLCEVGQCREQATIADRVEAGACGLDRARRRGGVPIDEPRLRNVGTLAKALPGHREGDEQPLMGEPAQRRLRDALDEAGEEPVAFVGVRIGVARAEREGARRR